MNLLFTTGWGLLYMVVLFILMGWALTKTHARTLAVVMFGLWVCDRIAVNSLAPNEALLYLAYAYTLCGVSLLLFYLTRASIVVAAMLFVGGTYFALGYFGVASWDMVGTVQEITGLIAMLTIIWRRNDGSRIYITKGGLASDNDQRGSVSASSVSHSPNERHKGHD